jgi:hypothetical protein
LLVRKNIFLNPEEKLCGASLALHGTSRFGGSLVRGIFIELLFQYWLITFFRSDTSFKDITFCQRKAAIASFLTSRLARLLKALPKKKE